MRQHLYNFVHRVLPHDVHNEPALWRIISGDRAPAYLSMRWDEAASDAPACSPKGLIWIEPVALDGATLRIVRLPPPESASEAHYAAIVQCADGKLRYFVAEKGMSKTFIAEWRAGAHLRGGDLEEDAASDALPELRERASQASPWEVSADAIPGMPYLSSFIEAIRGELRATPKGAAPALPLHAPAIEPRGKMPLIVVGVAASALLVVLVLLFG
jgi:hypothetical protein